MTTENLRIGELSTCTGCGIETIRYYERIGLMPEPARTAAGYRLYAHEHVRRLRFIRRARKLGFTLDEVRGLLRLSGSDHSACNETRALGLAHLREAQRKIADLERLVAALDEMTRECGEDEHESCPFLNVLWTDTE